VRLRKTAPARVGSAWAWYGWVVFAVDGSRADAPRTCRNERALGQSARDKSHPQWWITQLIHLPTKLIWDWRQGPGTSSERAHMREMMPSLPKSSLLVGDIGFGGFDLLWQLSNEQVAFVIRCGGSSTLLVEHTRQQIERQGDIRWVYLWPKNRRRKKPLRLRLIVLKRHGKRVYLLTNVQESTRLSRRIVSLTLEYIKTNAHRMDYARYRRQGLPVTSAIVESLITQFNQRVKGTEKFWIQGSAEAVLQIRAAYLSEDDRAERFHEQRPRGRAAGRNRQKLAA